MKLNENSLFLYLEAVIVLNCRFLAHISYSFNCIYWTGLGRTLCKIIHGSSLNTKHMFLDVYSIIIRTTYLQYPENYMETTCASLFYNFSFVFLCYVSGWDGYKFLHKNNQISRWIGVEVLKRPNYSSCQNIIICTLGYSSLIKSAN